MTFEPKISGTRVSDFSIEVLFDSQIISLTDAMHKVKRQETMDFLLDTFRFSKCKDGEWRAIIDWDTNYKLAIMERYPEYEKEMIAYFGENWLSHYVRFGH